MSEETTKLRDRVVDRPVEPDGSVSYWRQRCKEAEVEWVCNVVSALMGANGMPPIPGVHVTARGLMAASRCFDIAAGRRTS
jgi:hypothetical protein